MGFPFIYFFAGIDWEVEVREGHTTVDFAFLWNFHRLSHNYFLCSLTCHYFLWFPHNENFVILGVGWNHYIFCFGIGWLICINLNGLVYVNALTSLLLVNNFFFCLLLHQGLLDYWNTLDFRGNFDLDLFCRCFFNLRLCLHQLSLWLCLHLLTLRLSLRFYFLLLDFSLFFHFLFWDAFLFWLWIFGFSVLYDSCFLLFFFYLFHWLFGFLFYFRLFCCLWNFSLRLHLWFFSLDWFLNCFNCFHPFLIFSHLADKNRLVLFSRIWEKIAFLRRVRLFLFSKNLNFGWDQVRR